MAVSWSLLSRHCLGDLLPVLRYVSILCTGNFTAVERLCRQDKCQVLKLRKFCCRDIANLRACITVCVLSVCVCVNGCVFTSLECLSVVLEEPHWDKLTAMVVGTTGIKYLQNHVCMAKAWFTFCLGTQWMTVALPVIV